MCGVLRIFNKLFDGFITGHRHPQLDLDMMAKREKLLAIYGAIPHSMWEEMALQLLSNPPNFQNRVWGL